MTPNSSAATSQKPVILALLLVLLVVGVAAGFSVAWYGLLPDGVRDALHGWSRLAAFLPMWGVVLVLFVRGRREAKQTRESAN